MRTSSREREVQRVVGEIVEAQRDVDRALREPGPDRSRVAEQAALNARDEEREPGRGEQFVGLDRRFVPRAPRRCCALVSTAISPNACVKMKRAGMWPNGNSPMPSQSAAPN